MRTVLRADAAGCALADPAIAQVARSKFGEKFGECVEEVKQDQVGGLSTTRYTLRSPMGRSSDRRPYCHARWKRLLGSLIRVIVRHSVECVESHMFNV